MMPSKRRKGSNNFKLLPADGICVQLVARAGVDKASLSKALIERLNRSLSAAGAVGAKLEVEFVGQLKPSSELMGKTKLIVSRPERAHA